MNIALFVNRDIYCAVALNHLIGGLAEHPTTIFVSDKVGRAPDVEALDVLRLIEQDIPYDHVFPSVDSGGKKVSGTFSAPEKVPDTFTGGELLTPRFLERRHAIRFEAMNAPNSPEALARLRGLELDVVVSIRYGRIFQRDFLDIPRLGVLNLHSGLLPGFRGVMASFHALAAMSPEIGCTLHYIDDATIDTGRIVAEWRRPVDPAQSYFGHVLSLYAPGARLVREALVRLEKADALEAAPQPSPGGTYFSFPGTDDVARFEANGFRLFHASEYRELLRRFCGR